MVTKTKWGVFGPAFERRWRWNKESDPFIELAPYAVKRAFEETQGFAEFNEVVEYKFETDNKLPGWLQVQFGQRILFRPDYEGRPSAERGPTLTYSRGPTGEMYVMMYPIKSEVASVAEDSIMLRMGYFNYWDLYLGVRRDVRDLIAYAYCTSIDLTPSWRQSLRIRWLRFASSQHVEGKHQYSPLWSGLWSLLKMAGAGSFTGIFRFLAPAALGWAVATYGNEWIKGLFQ